MKIKYHCIYLSSFLILIGCGYRVEPSKYIPKDVSYVQIFDLIALQKYNLSFPIEKKIWNKNIPNEIQDYIIKNYKKAGINTNFRAYRFGKETTNPNDNYTAWIFHLSDEKLFDQFIRNIPKLSISVKSHIGMYYFEVNNMIVAWHNKIAWILYTATPKSSTELRNYVLKLREMPSHKALKTKNIAFQELMKQKTQTSLWLNWEHQNDDLKDYIKEMTGFELEKKEHYLTCNFQLDSLQNLSINTKIYPEIKSLSNFKSFFKDYYDKKLLAEIPNDSLAGVWNWSLKKQGWEELQKTWKSQEWIKNLLTIEGMQYEKWFDIITGDGILAQKSSNKDIEEIWGFKIKNKPLLEIALKQMTLQKRIDKKNNNLFFWKEKKYFIFIKDKIVLITPSQKIIKTLNKKSTITFTDKLPENVSMYGYFIPKASLLVSKNKKLSSWSKNKDIEWFILPIQNEILEIRQNIKKASQQDFWEILTFYYDKKNK
jgi:hypothetical protein